MRKVIVLMCAVIASLAALVGSASANSGPAARPDPAPGWTKVAASDVSTQALSCDPGRICAWPVVDGSSSRCSWVNSDNDWWNAPTVCSWSSSRPVKALYNHGQNANFEGVCVYRGANNTNVELFLFQGESATNSTGVILRSHRWVRVGQPC